MSLINEFMIEPLAKVGRVVAEETSVVRVLVTQLAARCAASAFMDEA